MQKVGENNNHQKKKKMKQMKLKKKVFGKERTIRLNSPQKKLI